MRELASGLRRKSIALFAAGVLVGISTPRALADADFGAWTTLGYNIQVRLRCTTTADASLSKNLFFAQFRNIGSTPFHFTTTALLTGVHPQESDWQDGGTLTPGQSESRGGSYWYVAAPCPDNGQVTVWVRPYDSSSAPAFGTGGTASPSPRTAVPGSNGNSSGTISVLPSGEVSHPTAKPSPKPSFQSSPSSHDNIGVGVRAGSGQFLPTGNAIRSAASSIAATLAANAAQRLEDDRAAAVAADIERQRMHALYASRGNDEQMGFASAPMPIIRTDSVKVAVTNYVDTWDTGLRCDSGTNFEQYTQSLLANAAHPSSAERGARAAMYDAIADLVQFHCSDTSPGDYQRDILAQRDAAAFLVKDDFELFSNMLTKYARSLEKAKAAGFPATSASGIMQPKDYVERIRTLCTNYARYHVDAGVFPRVPDVCNEILREFPSYRE